VREPRLENPFTPRSLASGEGDFFGRSHEIGVLQDNLDQGHIAIHGPVGIGKSSLLARISKVMQGEFNAEHRSVLVQGVCSQEIKTSDQAAALILSALPTDTQSKIKWKFGTPFFGVESEGSSSSASGETPMSVLRRFVIDAASNQMEYFIIAFDQAENCPGALTALVRTLATSVELKGCKKLRIILSGVSPYFDKVTDGDTGLKRVFSQVRVLPLHADEATELVETKFRAVISESERIGLHFEIDPKVIEGIVRLSGGHPHVIQLLGSHLIQHENSNPDDLIDARDLGGAVRRICYEDRGDIYDQIIETLETADMLRPLVSMLALARSKFPTVIKTKDAKDVVGKDFVDELIRRDIFVREGKVKLRLVDEFLSLRLALDRDSEPGTGHQLRYDDEEVQHIFGYKP
jgi:AAA ATPase domain